MEFVPTMAPEVNEIIKGICAQNIHFKMEISLYFDEDNVGDDHPCQENHPLDLHGVHEKEKNLNYGDTSNEIQCILFGSMIKGFW